MNVKDTQKLQIEWEITDWKERKDTINKTFDLVNPRMKDLWRDSYLLEMALVHSQTMEHMLKIIIYGYQVKGRILIILGANNPHNNSVNIDDEPTLGSLIGKLKSYTGKTKLVTNLTDFNLKIRREVTHHIFDGTREIESFNELIKKFFGENWQGEGFREMVDGLKLETKKISKQIEDLQNQIK